MFSVFAQYNLHYYFAQEAFAGKEASMQLQVTSLSADIEVQLNPTFVNSACAQF